MLTSIKTLSRRTLAICNQLGWLGHTLIRLVVGLGFAFDGWVKLHNLDNITDYFTELNIPMPHANAVFVSAVELGAGLLLVIGLGTRIASLLLIGVMGVALVTAILPKAESVLGLFSTIEVTYLAIFVWLVLVGGGRLSIDALLARRGAGGAQVGEAA